MDTDSCGKDWGYMSLSVYCVLWLTQTFLGSIAGRANILNSLENDGKIYLL